MTYRPLTAALEAGQDYARNGANETNCHFRHFATAAQKLQWERGRDSIQTGSTDIDPSPDVKGNQKEQD